MNDKTDEGSLYDIRAIESYFKNDGLYKFLIQSFPGKLIATPVMINDLHVGRIVNVVTASIMTGMDKVTIRNLLNATNCKRMPEYIRAQKSGNRWLLTECDVYKLRMAYLVNKELRLPYNRIAEMGLAHRTINDDTLGRTQTREIETPPYAVESINRKRGKPSPEILEKIAEHSQNNSVTYEKLKECLNYITEPSILDDYRKKIDEDYLEIKNWINSGECETYIRFAFKLWKSGILIDRF